MHLRCAVRAWLSLGGERRAVSAERASLVHEAGTGEDQAASPAHELLAGLVRCLPVIHASLGRCNLEGVSAGEGPQVLRRSGAARCHTLRSASPTGGPQVLSGARRCRATRALANLTIPLVARRSMYLGGVSLRNRFLGRFRYSSAA